MPKPREPLPSPLDAVKKMLETGAVGGGRAPDNAAMPQNGNTVLPQSSNEVMPQSGNTAMQQYSNAAILQSGNAAMPQSSVTAILQSSNEAREKATFYLAPGQLEKLDDLAHAYRKRTGRRVNRNEIIRFLIERAELEMLLTEW